jgi:hypothetical protein
MEDQEDLLEALDDDVLAISFDWIDNATKNGVLDWGEIWSHIGTENSGSGSDFLIDDPWRKDFSKENSTAMP